MDWILAKEKLPRDDKPFLIEHDEKVYSAEIINEDTIFIHDGCGCCATTIELKNLKSWMPLPPTSL